MFYSAKKFRYVICREITGKSQICILFLCTFDRTVNDGWKSSFSWYAWTRAIRWMGYERTTDTSEFKRDTEYLCGCRYTMRVVEGGWWALRQMSIPCESFQWPPSPLFGRRRHSVAYSCVRPCSRGCHHTSILTSTRITAARSVYETKTYGHNGVVRMSDDYTVKIRVGKLWRVPANGGRRCGIRQRM